MRRDPPYTEEELNRAPQADSVAIAFCENPQCLRPHVILLDRKGKPIAQFTVPDPHDGFNFVEVLQRAQYRSAVERDGS